LLKIYIKENVNDTQYNVSRQKGLKALTAALKKNENKFKPQKRLAFFFDSRATKTAKSSYRQLVQRVTGPKTMKWQ